MTSVNSACERITVSRPWKIALQLGGQRLTLARFDDHQPFDRRFALGLERGQRLAIVGDPWYGGPNQRRWNSGGRRSAVM